MIRFYDSQATDINIYIPTNIHITLYYVHYLGGVV